MRAARTPGATPTCEAAGWREGFYIRGFECISFNRLSRGSPIWNTSQLEERMGTDRFRRTFEACIEAQLDNSHKKNGWATSFLRDDLPIKSYGDKFGWLIHAAPSQLKCAYAFDAYKGFGKLPTSTRPASQLLRRRATTVRRACVRWKHTPMAGVWAQHQSPELNCCFAEREDALWAQREYVALNHSSKCERGNGLNQMQLAWRANDIFGVYYVLDHDARHAR